MLRSLLGVPVLVALLAAFGTSVVGCQSKEDGTVESSLSVGGKTRTFNFHLPPAHGADPAKKWPLVLVLHGSGGDAVNAEEMTHFTAIAEAEGFVVVYPEGEDDQWNDRRGGGSEADDVTFIRALIDDEIAKHAVDPRRVYVTGMSNGGMMSFRLACELSDKIAAASAVAGLMPKIGEGECRPTHPMPMAIIAGSEDPIVPYGGGEIVGDRGEVLSADATRQKWADLARCAPIDQETTIDPTDDETKVFRTAHSRCEGGAEVILFTVSGGGHTWPNGDQYLPKGFVGRVTKDIDASHELWQFFARHELR